MFCLKYMLLFIFQTSNDLIISFISLIMWSCDTIHLRSLFEIKSLRKWYIFVSCIFSKSTWYQFLILLLDLMISLLSFFGHLCWNYIIFKRPLRIRFMSYSGHMNGILLADLIKWNVVVYIYRTNQFLVIFETRY